jgi:hypothetical protein
MHRETHTLLFATFCMWLSACAPQPLPRVEIPRDSRISLTIARASQRLRIQVLACAARDSECTQGHPVERVAVAVQTPQGNHELGLTGDNGWLELPLSQLDPLFPIETTSKSQLASLIVSGQGVAEIPVGSIVHRHEIAATTISEAETVLGLSQQELEGDWWYYSQELLGRMLELQLRGEANAELVQLATRLHKRLANSQQATWFGARWWNSVKDVLDRIFASGDDADVPDGLQERAHSGDPRASEDLEQSLEWLPEACNVTVIGTGVAAQIALGGQPALAVALIGAVIGSEIRKWMVDACCNIASDTLSGARSPVCSAL